MTNKHESRYNPYSDPPPKQHHRVSMGGEFIIVVAFVVGMWYLFFVAQPWIHVVVIVTATP